MDRRVPTALTLDPDAKVYLAPAGSDPRTTPGVPIGSLVSLTSSPMRMSEPARVEATGVEFTATWDVEFHLTRLARDLVAYGWDTAIARAIGRSIGRQYGRDLADRWGLPWPDEEE